ncbi:MAG TPA: hypothetical protein VGN83_14605 [Falsiroseomonas sp.]|jgi:predicted acylesterase/phospholipase RssA|nr:hypothetical protein [Falsiroseomonas sp.]
MKRNGSRKRAPVALAAGAACAEGGTKQTLPRIVLVLQGGGALGA